MRNEDRNAAQRKLDKELRFYRLAARQKNCTQELLRAVRQALDIPVAEIARTLEMNRSVLFGLEQSEERGTISMMSMERVASAMGCTARRWWHTRCEHNTGILRCAQNDNG